MHPGSTHYGIEPYAYILADMVAKHELQYGTANGGVTTLNNAYCILYFNVVETSVGVKFAFSNAPEKQYGVLDFLLAIVPDGGRKYPLHVPDSVTGENRVKQEIGLIRDVLASGVMDAVLQGDKSWIPTFEMFSAEYDRLHDLSLGELLEDHPEEDRIWLKQKAFDLTWMDDVRRILAEQESKS